MKPSECWRCLALFERDDAPSKQFRLRVYASIGEAASKANVHDAIAKARAFVDEHYADEHTQHERRGHVVGVNTELVNVQVTLHHGHDVNALDVAFVVPMLVELPNPESDVGYSIDDVLAAVVEDVKGLLRPFLNNQTHWDIAPATPMLTNRSGGE